MALYSQWHLFTLVTAIQMYLITEFINSSNFTVFILCQSKNMYLNRSKVFLPSSYIYLLNLFFLCPKSKAFREISYFGSLPKGATAPWHLPICSRAEGTYNSWISYHSFVIHLSLESLLHTLASLISMKRHFNHSFDKILIPLPLLSYSLGNPSFWINLSFCLFSACI